ncbi:MAG: hypothetical protein KKH68_01845 [Proteobacteria bacterium]|nr:hypothetical protein [Pseudomonadota bacterium]
MGDTTKEFELDLEAQSLLAQLHGIDKREIEDEQREALKKIDDWRVCLVELAHFLVFAFKGAGRADSKLKDGSASPNSTDLFAKLAEVPSDDGKILIRYRGLKLDSGKAGAPNEYDYVISLGGIWIDIPMAKEVTRRHLVEVSDLAERLANAFRILAAMKIFTLQLDISNWSSENLRTMNASIKFLSKYLTSSPTAPDKLALDGKKQLDPNLYVLAALNGLQKEKLHQLIQYVQNMKSDPKTSKALAQYSSIFDAVFAFKKLKAQLVKPTVEVNNIIYLELLRDCFDKDGRFLRDNFAKHVPKFARWEKMVFNFLWNDFKSIMHRKDRIAFLNSLRLMIHHLHDPQKPFELMIKDFCDLTEGVKFSDRNAIVLIIILIFKYDHHMRLDIELTPWEVFEFKVDTKSEMAKKAVTFLDGDGEGPFTSKVDFTHRALRKLLDADKGDVQAMPLPYLLSLVREIYIFLALIGGVTAHKILRSALEDYGNPQAKIYTLKGSQDHMKALIQLLQVAIRGLSRLGHAEDLSLFKEIRRNEKQFVDLKTQKHADLEQHTDLVRRTMHYLDAFLK